MAKTMRHDEYVYLLTIATIIHSDGRKILRESHVKKKLQELLDSGTVYAHSRKCVSFHEIKAITRAIYTSIVVPGLTMEHIVSRLVLQRQFEKPFGQAPLYIYMVYM